MARVIVACPHCKARFDVSSFKPGSKIRCGSCYKILVIPDRVARAAPKEFAAGKAGAPKRTVDRRGKQAKRSARPSVPPEPEAAPQKQAAAVKEKTPSSTENGDGGRTKTLAAAPTPSSGDPLIGTRINGEFEIVKKLGQGGYGTVYEAVDLTLKRRVAVKLMLREKTTNREFVDKFLREARTAAQLSHPNIVKIHLVSFCKELQQHFLAMEYVEGRTLSDIMAEDGAFSVEHALDVLIQAANGLAEAHRKNIIHRDIKPGNIMITPKGVVKVTDFGLAKIYDPDDAASMVIGTPYFMPPEQFEGKARDGRTDIYALGVTIYFLLTLKRPFDGKTPAQVLLNVMQKDPVVPHELNPEIPPELSKIILKMLARKLSERYSSCEDLLRDVKRLQADHGEEAVFCPNCGLTNPFTALKCSECGTSLLEPCPKCGTADSIGAKFCGNCGANLAKERQVAALLKEANAHEAAGRLEDALTKYREAKDAAPENTRAIEGVRRAELLRTEREEMVASLGAMLDEGRFLEALEVAEEAAEKFPDHRPFGELVHRAREGAKDERLSEGLGRVQSLLDAGDLVSACDAARSAIEIDPSSEEAQKRLQEAELAVERHAEARDKAAGLEERQRLAQALLAWKEALELMPVDETAQQAVERIEGVLLQMDDHRTRAEAALDDKDLDQARLSLAEAVGADPSNPRTQALLDRLRREESSLREGLEDALASFAAGRFDEGISALETLSTDFPLSREIPEAIGSGRALADLGGRFFDAAKRHLERGRVSLAKRYVELARGTLGGGPRVDELASAIERSAGERVSTLARVRGLIDRGEFEEAAAALEPLGGMCAERADVAELARSVAEGAMRQPGDTREKRTEVLASALTTARELLDAGQYHAARSACQKALRIDRHSEEARSLKDEIDSALEAINQAGTDSRIETGFFNIEDLDENG